MSPRMSMCAVRTRAGCGETNEFVATLLLNVADASESTRSRHVNLFPARVLLQPWLEMEEQSRRCVKDSSAWARQTHCQTELFVFMPSSRRTKLEYPNPLFVAAPSSHCFCVVHKYTHSQSIYVYGKNTSNVDTIHTSIFIADCHTVHFAQLIKSCIDCRQE